MIDSHCHLNDEKLCINVKNIVDRYLSDGVEKVVNIGTDIESSILARDQAEEFESVYYSVGMYPEYWAKYDEEEFEQFLISCMQEKEKGLRDANFSQILRKNKLKYVHKSIYDKNGKNKLLAIGEIGLDYYWDKEHKEEQQKMFISQIKLAKKYDLPIIIHNREASGDILDILKQNAPFNRGGIIHCFSASLEWAMEVIKLGFYISFSGSVTFKNATNLQEAAKHIPEDRLLVETDSPYLAPVPFRGQINEPKNVVEVANFIASLKGVSYDYINNLVTKNFNKLFKF